MATGRVTRNRTGPEPLGTGSGTGTVYDRFRTAPNRETAGKKVAGTVKPPEKTVVNRVKNPRFGTGIGPGEPVQRFHGTGSGTGTGTGPVEPAQRFRGTGTGTGPVEPAHRFHGTGSPKVTVYDR